MGASSRTWAFLLLGLLLTSFPGALGTNPGLVVRITDKGLEYVAREGLVTLQSELQEITLPDFTGDFKIKHVGRGHYEFHSLDIHSCELRGSALTPLPGQGLSLSISDSFIRLQGKWKVRKSFLKLQGSFDMEVKGITILVNLVLGSEPSGRPTVTASSCSSDIRDVEVDISGGLGWLLNLFHNKIESNFQKILEIKICQMVQKSVTSDLQPYLQTLPVTTEIGSFAGVDYSLMEAPQATAQMLDVMLKAEIFNHDHRSPVDFLAPVMSLPEEHNRMVYFAISDYVFNTASLVYHEAGYLNFNITDDMVPPTSKIRLTTKSFRAFAPRLARQYPNMNLELQGAMVSAPFLNFSPGNLSLAPQMEIKAFVLLPSSIREPVFRLSVACNVSATLTFNISKITGFLKPEEVQMELKESKVGVFNVEMLEALLNYYLINSLYPKVNEKLANGFPLPLLKHIQLSDPVLQIHKQSYERDAMITPLQFSDEKTFTSERWSDLPNITQLVKLYSLLCICLGLGSASAFAVALGSGPLLLPISLPYFLFLHSSFPRPLPGGASPLLCNPTVLYLSALSETSPLSTSCYNSFGRGSRM